MYEDNNAHSASEEMLLKATVEPIFISARRHDTANDTKTAFTGTSQPGRTWRVRLADLESSSSKDWVLHMRATRRTERLDHVQKRRAAEMPWQQ